MRSDLTKQKLCALTLLRELDIHPVMHKHNTLYAILDGHFLYKDSLWYFKTTVRNVDIDAYKEVWMQDKIFNSLLKRYKEGVEAAYFVFFKTSKPRTYNAIAYNMSYRFENTDLKQVEWIRRSVPTATTWSNGSYTIKRFMKLYKEEYDRTYTHIVIPKQPRKQKPIWKPRD